jgi:uncharacterized protein (DUF3820 family)
MDPIKNTPEQHREMVETVNMKMPFGKFKGRCLVDLPEPYLVWFNQQGFPAGKLGQRLQLMYEIKLNGLEHIFKKLKH